MHIPYLSKTLLFSTSLLLLTACGGGGSSNTAPKATAQSLTFNEDTSNNSITLAGTDADGDALTYEIVTSPTHGSLSGTAPNLTYTPTANYFGNDSFSFTVNDGTVDSSPAIVSITVNDVVEPDVTAPIISLNGESNISMYVDQNYIELNATATDAVEGNVTSSIVITGAVDVTRLGVNTLTYTATDSAGNEANVTRTVNVLSILKKTGQTKSYDTDGNEVADGSLKDDGFYQKGTTPSYTRDNTNETVLDNLTGLMWQDDLAVASVTKQWLTDANYNTCSNDKTDPACFDTTGDTAATYCSELVMGGHEDWRLPTSVELEGIVNYGVRNPAIDSTFQNTASSYYWSSSSFVGNENGAWIVDFNYGNVNGDYKDYDGYVRCVRVGQ